LKAEQIAVATHQTAAVAIAQADPTAADLPGGAAFIIGHYPQRVWSRRMGQL